MDSNPVIFKPYTTMLRNEHGFNQRKDAGRLQQIEFAHNGESDSG